MAMAVDHGPSPAGCHPVRQETVQSSEDRSGYGSPAAECYEGPSAQSSGDVSYRERHRPILPQPIRRSGQNGDDPESPNGVRSPRCGSSLKTRTEGSGCLLLTRQHSTFDQDRHTRIWIDAAQGLPGDSTRFDNLLIPTSDFLNSITQTKRNFP